MFRVLVVKVFSKSAYPLSEMCKAVKGYMGPLSDFRDEGLRFEIFLSTDGRLFTPIHLIIFICLQNKL